MADLVACPSRYDPTDTNFDNWCRDSINYAGGDGGQDALIFTIGLGDQVINTAYGQPDAGEQLLRYIANVGSDGHPDPEWDGGSGLTELWDRCLAGPPVGPAPAAQNCGNYYFAPTGDQLVTIFEDIADRIFTRIIQ
jgi:hypothetical protein